MVDLFVKLNNTTPSLYLR